MCYYDHYEWSCKDWKWGNFRQHCQKEYRIGETCGMKFVYQTHPVAGLCKICQKIEAKDRRIAKHKDDLARWARDSRNFRASIEVAVAEVRQIQSEIDMLKVEKYDKYRMIGNSRRC